MGLDHCEKTARVSHGSSVSTAQSRKARQMIVSYRFRIRIDFRALLELEV